MTKKNELANPESCLNKAGTDEPIFVLRAKDPRAPMVIRHWATMSEGEQPPEKLEEALKLAEVMQQHRAQHYPNAAEQPVRR